MLFNFLFFIDSITFKMEKCPNCNKSFTRKDNLRRHQQKVCGLNSGSTSSISTNKNTNSNRKRKCIQSTNVLSKKKKDSEEFKHCSSCNLTIPKKFYYAHLQSRNHKDRSSINTLDPGVQILDCAFKNRIITYRISPTRSHDNFNEFFEEIKQKVIRLVNNEIDKHRSIKLNLVLYCSFILETQEIKENKSFNTKNKILTISSDVSKSYEEFKDELSTQATEFEATGSGKYNTNFL